MKALAIFFVILIALVTSMVPISGFMIKKGFANKTKDWAPAMVRRGVRIRMFMKQYSVSANIFEKVLKTFPTHPDRAKIHFWLGMCYEKSGDLDKSRQWYTAFIEKFPTNQWIDQAKSRMQRLDAQ